MFIFSLPSHEGICPQVFFNEVITSIGPGGNVRGKPVWRKYSHVYSPVCSDKRRHQSWTMDPRSRPLNGPLSHIARHQGLSRTPYQGPWTLISNPDPPFPPSLPEMVIFCVSVSLVSLVLTRKYHSDRKPLASLVKLSKGFLVWVAIKILPSVARVWILWIGKTSKLENVLENSHNKAVFLDPRDRPHV